jgi:hypothetical protein
MASIYLFELAAPYNGPSYVAMAEGGLETLKGTKVMVIGPTTFAGGFQMTDGFSERALFALDLLDSLAEFDGIHEILLGSVDGLG